MKSPLKAFLLTVAILLTVIALGWVGGVLYWHLRVKAILRTWEQNLTPPPTRLESNSGLSNEDFSALWEAGCRALPAMVAALNASTNRAFQQLVMNQIILVLSNRSFYGPFDFARMDEFYTRWGFRADGTELEQRYKMDDFNAWWNEHGGECHRAWRFWTGRCGNQR